MPIKWFTLRSIYVDIDTGELIDERHLQHYSVIKGDKKTFISENQKFGNIQWVMKCRIKNQLKLF